MLQDNIDSSHFIAYQNWPYSAQKNSRYYPRRRWNPKLEKKIKANERKRGMATFRTVMYVVAFQQLSFTEFYGMRNFGHQPYAML